MKNEHPGVTCLYKFIDAFNTAEKIKIIKNLHFPITFTLMEMNQLFIKMVKIFGNH